MENGTQYERKVTFGTHPTISVNAIGGGGGGGGGGGRKLSFPGTLKNCHLLGAPGGGEESLKAIRRFSNVSDAVSRKLSTTIGWRMPTMVSPEEVAAQGRVLCNRYIRSRLKRAGIFNRKLGLFRARSSLGTSGALVVRQVFPGLVAAGVELERHHAAVYRNVSRQAGGQSPAGSSTMPEKNGGGGGALLAAIGHDLFKRDITWGKVVSIFAVAGSLGVDCICHGHPEHLNALIEGMAEVLEDDLGEWIASNGGWLALAQHCKPEDGKVTTIEYVTVLGVVVSALLIFYVIFRVFNKLQLF